MASRVAGIDVHKKRLAVVATDVEVEGEYRFERRRYGSNPVDLRRMSEWLIEQQVDEVVMESTAQYWQPVWVHWNDTGRWFPFTNPLLKEHARWLFLAWKYRACLL